MSLDFLGGSGPMWFALALLIFSAVYSIFRLIFHNSEKSQTDVPLPGHLDVVVLSLLISVCAFAIRLAQPIGTSIINMQLCYFSQYVILFIVGIAAYRRNWFARIPYSFGIVWFKISLIVGSIFLTAIMILGGGISGDFSKYSGGFYWQSVAYALWESFYCAGICLGIVLIFREHFNKQGKFTIFMSQNSFSVYVFHPPILILVTLAIRNLAWHPVLKFMTAIVISIPLCFMISCFVLRRVPLLKKVL